MLMGQLSYPLACRMVGRVATILAPTELALSRLSGRAGRYRRTRKAVMLKALTPISRGFAAGAAANLRGIIMPELR